MGRDELILWGRIKAKVQQFLDKFLEGLKIPKRIVLSHTDLSNIIFKSWKHSRENKTGHTDIFMEAQDAVIRHKTGWDKAHNRSWKETTRILTKTKKLRKVRQSPRRTRAVMPKHRAMCHPFRRIWMQSYKEFVRISKLWQKIIAAKRLIFSRFYKVDASQISTFS